MLPKGIDVPIPDAWNYLAVFRVHRMNLLDTHWALICPFKMNRIDCSSFVSPTG